MVFPGESGEADDLAALVDTMRTGSITPEGAKVRHGVSQLGPTLGGGVLAPREDQPDLEQNRGGRCGRDAEGISA